MTPEYVIEPTHINEGLVVERVYAQPPEESPDPRPDTDSHVAFTEYAFSRFDPRFNGSDPVVLTRTVAEPARRTRRGEGWVGDITPRLSAAVFLATTAVANLAGNFQSLSADAHEAWDQFRYTDNKIISTWTGHEQPTKTKTVETSEPGGVIYLDQNYPQPVGESAPNQSDITKLVDEIKDEQSRGNTVTRVYIFAGSSDEWGPHESTLQVPNKENDDLDNKRASDAANELKRQLEADGLEAPEIEIATYEDILSADEVADLKDAAARGDLSLDDAIRIYNNGGHLPPALQALLQSKLGDARSVAIRIELQEPDQTVIDTVPVHDTAPENKDHDYDLYLGLPLPIFPRLRREDYLKPRTETWVRPGAKPDERWVELYPEALQDDGSLLRDAWRHTRKYQLLAREDRIDYSLTHTYTDAEGEVRDMRVMFIDHDPTEETIAMYKRLLTDVAQMKDGKVAERWSAITVFPRAQVGTDPTPGREDPDYPHHPKDIGLDIDKQDPSGVLGVAMPALGLIEAHMPENPTDEELNAYYGALWTSAHELGHAADTTGESTYLVPAGPAAFRHYNATSTFADTAADAFKALPNVDAEGDRDLSVTWQVATPSGRVVTLRDEVRTADGGDSPLLGISQTATLNGRNPDEYAGTSAGELYGQVAAQVISGAPIPYDVAGLNVTARDPELGRGYGVDPELQRMFEEHTGWSRATARPVNDNEFALTLATDDPMLRQFIDDARRTPMPGNRITILSRVVGLEQ